MDLVNIYQLQKRLSLVAKKELTTQNAYYIVNKLLGLEKVNKWGYDWEKYIRMEDSGLVQRVVDKYLRGEYDKKKEPIPVFSGKRTSYEIPKDETSMDYLSNQMLKDDEVWYESRRKINKIIREELLRLC